MKGGAVQGVPNLKKAFPGSLSVSQYSRPHNFGFYLKLTEYHAPVS